MIKSTKEMSQVLNQIRTFQFSTPKVQGMHVMKMKLDWTEMLSKSKVTREGCQKFSGGRQGSSINLPAGMGPYV